MLCIINKKKKKFKLVLNNRVRMTQLWVKIYNKHTIEVETEYESNCTEATKKK